MTSFICTIVGISLSGVMAPGPITAATLAAGERNRHAGAWICVGHILVELPLIVILAADRHQRCCHSGYGNPSGQA
jgi:threonine/homoserine/homoserine lactone efflux protein